MDSHIHDGDFQNIPTSAFNFNFAPPTITAYQKNVIQLIHRKMKFFFTLLTLGFAVISAAEPVSKAYRKRDLAAFQGVISAVNDQVLVLQAALTAFNGGDGTDIRAANDKLVATINAGVITVNAQPALTFSEGVSLTQPILDLTDVVNATVDVAIKKEQVIADAGLHAEVLADLKAQKASSEALAATITAKVPSSLQGIAASLSAGISNALQRGIDAYSD